MEKPRLTQCLGLKAIIPRGTLNPMDETLDLRMLRDAGLIYVSDREPGISRKKRGRAFSYHLPEGDLLRDPTERNRIVRLGVPPAYRDVWICLSANGHLQATGFDERGRKQYRYHNDWHALQDEKKFHQLSAFGHTLPAIRRRARLDAEQQERRLTATLGALVLLLDATHLRIGNRQYAEENGTYGASTLLKRHVRFGETLELRFVAKGGKRVSRQMRSPRLQRILEGIADLPGRELFVWQDEAGAVRPVDSSQLNRYIAEISGIAASAKTFRTWGGTVAAFSCALRTLQSGERVTIKAMAEASAEELSNTPTISRKSYIHPKVLAIASDQMAAETAQSIASEALPRREGLRIDEQRLIGFLEAG